MLLLFCLISSIDIDTTFIEQFGKFAEIKTIPIKGYLIGDDGKYLYLLSENANGQKTVVKIENERLGNYLVVYLHKNNSEIFKFYGAVIGSGVLLSVFTHGFFMFESIPIWGALGIWDFVLGNNVNNESKIDIQPAYIQPYFAFKDLIPEEITLTAMPVK